MKSGLKIASSVAGVFVAAGTVAAIALSGGSGDAAAPAKTPQPTATVAVARPTLAPTHTPVQRSAPIKPAKPRHRHRVHASHPARGEQPRGIIARTKGSVVTNPQHVAPPQPAAPSSTSGQSSHRPPPGLGVGQSGVVVVTEPEPSPQEQDQG